MIIHYLLLISIADMEAEVQKKQTNCYTITTSDTQDRTSGNQVVYKIQFSLFYDMYIGYGQ